MTFNYPDPALRVMVQQSNEVVTLSWPSLVGRRFSVQGSGNLVSWTNVMTNVVATGSNTVASFYPGEGREFWRVVREQ